MDALSVYDNRELSWLKFNERVLEEAQDEAVPLFERLRFVSIFHSNLDEFFMIRVGSLHDQTLLKKETRENKTNMTALEQLCLIYPAVKRLLKRKDQTYAKLMERLALDGLTQVAFDSLSVDEYRYLELFFTREIMPVLSPNVIDGHHPFPFLQNKEIYVGVELDGKSKNLTIGVIPCTTIPTRIIYLPGDGTRFVLAEDLILFFAHKVFEGYTLLRRFLFRITRNADINVEEALYDHDLDFRDAMGELLKKRKKLSPVRLELSVEPSEKVCEWFCKRLDIAAEQIYAETSPLDMSFVSQLSDAAQSRRELYFPPLTPQRSPHIDYSEPVIKQVQRKDILLCYPYQHIRPFINLLAEAASDPAVMSIKITLYRVANESQIIDQLILAAENGKEVTALLELRARFDEENNINWSKRLEEAGCNVIYGLDELKVHSKLLLITRKIGTRIEYITQIGTGNYNEQTSRLYTDFSLITANKDIGIDASMVFNALAIGNTVEYARHLLVAPKCLKTKIVEMIDTEIAMCIAGAPAYIGVKINSLSDKTIIDKLIEASRAGVKVELIVRGICCLIAGVPGNTHNISVISIVGRFLEHSRIYIFGAGTRRQVYISSADFMTRNTERRVEVAVPLYDPDVCNRVVEMFNVMLKDNVKARVQLSDGSYLRRTPGESEPLNAQVYFYEQAYERIAKAEEERKAAEERRTGVVGRLIKRLLERGAKG